MADKLRIAMFISGGGTTMREILRAVASGRLSKIDPVLVIASTDTASGLQKALEEGVRSEDVAIVERKTFADPLAFGEKLLGLCRLRGVDFIGQYGWMPRTPPNVIDGYKGMMVNQHPGPLDPGRPDFGGKGMFGKRVHYARLHFTLHTQRDFWTEATAQYVAPEFDKGPVIRAERVSIAESDDTDSLQRRVLPAEHEVQIRTLEDFMNGTVPTFVRGELLVRPEEERILDEVKQHAGVIYPHG